MQCYCLNFLPIVSNTFVTARVVAKKMVPRLLKHVKTWLISNTDHWKDKTVFDLKQRCFYSRGSQKLSTNKTWYP